MQKPFILYIGAFRFPEGDAAAARVLGTGKVLRALGYEVVFGGGEAEGRPEDKIEPAGFSYQGFMYSSLGGLERKHSDPFRRIVHQIQTTKYLLHWIDGYRARGIAAIIAYHPLTPTYWALARYARRHKICLIIDITEWSTGRNLPGGSFGPHNIESEFRVRYLYRKSHGIIAVSSFLSDYFRSQRCEVVRIPPLVDLDEAKWGMITDNEPGYLKFVYAGSPGNKDLLGNIIQGVLLVGKEIKNIELHIVGVREDQACKLSGIDLTKLASSGAKIICHGRIPQNEVPKMLSSVDFSILLRPDAKNANAGFSTKLVESLCAGTPVIANATSDIAEYVRDGWEGFIVQGNSPEALASTLKIVAKLPREKILEMRSFAKDRARELFDYRSHCSELKRFIENVASD
jgi:glycosyltransferase involved in cell wall biosynthesis